MVYPAYMKRILKMDQQAYADINTAGLTQRYCLTNLMALGLLYGLASVYFTRHLIANANGSTISFSPLMVLLAGVVITFLLHGAAALFIWVFCRAIGGTTQLRPYYLNLGVAALAFIPLAPALAAYQISRAAKSLAGLEHFTATSGLLQAYVLLTAGYGLAVAYAAMHQASNLTNLKMAVASTVTVIYVGCLLYLWL